MKLELKKRLSLLLVAALAVMLVAVMSVSIVSGVSVAADNGVQDGDAFSFVQMSDIHYFPIDYCYQDVKNENYARSEFYQSTTGDTKLVLESGVILNNAVHQIIADAKAGKAPHYFIATGDLCKNGEREALIDVANSLRYLQNEMRKVSGYEHFQVFAQVGNHDLYNTDAALYSQVDGAERVADIVTSEQFAMIFAGLGFPNANLDGENGYLNLTEYLPEEYWGSEYTDGYQTSYIDEDVDISYYSAALQESVAAEGTEAKLKKYFEIGDEINQLSYAVSFKSNPGYGIIMFDSTDREETDAGNPVRMSRAEYEYILSKSSAPTVYFGNEDGSIDMTPVSASSVIAEFEAGKPVYRAASRSHITGGRLSEGVINWAEHEIGEQNAAGGYSLNEKTYIAAFHHNILPHFEQEDDILKDFTLYNWEYTARRFLEMGIRYVFTGHQHSSDIMSYTDIEGRMLYDSETGSMVSYESPRRYTTITRYDCGGKLGEQMTSSIYATLDMKEIASNHITTAKAWDQAAYDAAIAAYNASPTAENWQAVVASNPDYLAYIIQYEYMSKLNYNEYIGREIYTKLVDRMVDHFLTPDLLDGLVDSLTNMINGVDTSGFVAGMVFNVLGGKDTLAGVAEYLLDTLIYNLYPDTDEDGIGNYPYDGESYNGLMDWLLAIVDDLVNMSFGDDSIVSEVNPTNAGKLPLKEMANFIMMAHAAGVDFRLDETPESITDTFTEVECGDEHFRYMQPTDMTYRLRMLAALKDAHAQLLSGEFANNLFNGILDPLFNNSDSLLRTAFTHKFDFRDAVEKDYLTQDQYEAWAKVPDKLNELLSTAGSLLEGFGIVIPEDFSLELDMTDLTLENLVNQVVPIIKPLVANLIGFNLDGDGIFEILENAIDGYITQSFKVGLGGIADNIVMAYAYDIYPELTDMTDASKAFTAQPKEGYAYGNTKLSYLSTLNEDSAVGADFNAATQLNGRVPSRLTANFDTVQNTTAYTFKFYTAEDVYGTFKFKASEEDDWNSLSTSKANADGDYLTSTATKTFGDVTVNMVTETRPAYVPLIDLGLLCITHGEIAWEDADGNEIPFTFGQRDDSPGNSVIYWNVTTVTVTGLEPATTYLYDIEGAYEKANGDVISNSFVAYNKTLGYGKDYFTFTTAADENAEEFSFLTIADIQGMINGMYEDSFAAVRALMKDERTNNFNFILNAGDMVDNGKNFNQWSMALDTYQELFANSSQFFAAGNHEDGKNAFATYFNYTLPTDEDGNALQSDITDGAFYSFNYGIAHFIVLNTNDATADAGLGEVQYNWLVNDLENNEAKWTFVLMHKSLFSLGSHSYDAEVVAMREQLVPLFAQYGVNMVFGGHDHTYTVSNLVAEDGSVSEVKDISGKRYTGDGVMYITLGTMGTKFYNYSANDEVLHKTDRADSMLRTLDSQTFGKVDVTANSITFTGYYYDRESDSLKVIGAKQVLTDSPVFDSRIVYGIIGGGIALLVIVIVIIAVVVTKRRRTGGSGGSISFDSSDFEL